MKSILGLLKDKKNLIFLIIVFLFFTYSYFFALTQQVSWVVFLRNNSSLFVISQIILSLINSVVGSLCLLLIIRIFKERKNQEKASFIQTFSALFISVITTGCYVCGTVLFPAVGLTASFSTLPFAGLEIKVITAIFLLYSLGELLKNYKGICDIETPKQYKFSLGTKSFLFKLKYLQRVKPLLITSIFIILVFALPSLLPKNTEINSILNNKCDGVNCSCKVN